MGLFRRSGPVVFDRHAYGRRRSAFPIPRWLIILLVGVAAGAGGLLYWQQNYGPPRLTVEESQRLLSEKDKESRRLQADRDRIDGERTTLKSGLDDTTRQLEAARAENAKLSTDLGAARERIERLQSDVALFEQALPPDPRGGTVAVRSVRLTREPGALGYHVLLTREREGARSFKGLMEIVVAGVRAGGRNDTITVKPAVPTAFEGYQHLHGSASLPADFTPNQATIRVLDGPAGKVVGMRVFNVK